MELLRLIQNENLKLYKRIGTLIMAAILVITVLIFGFATPTENEENWKKDIESSVVEMEMMLENVPPDVTENQIEKINNELAINKYRLENNQKPTTNTMWAFMENATLFIPLVTLFTVIVAGGIVANEFSLGTIKLLLIRPITRGKILLSKYLSTFIFSLFLLNLLFITTFLVGGIKYGFGDFTLSHLVYENNQVVEKSILFYTFKLYAVRAVELIMMTSLAFMLSTVLRNNAIAIGTVLFLMFTGLPIVLYFEDKEWIKYVLFTNMDLTQYLHNSPFVEGMTLTTSLIVLMFYFTMFNLISWFVFKIRDVK